MTRTQYAYVGTRTTRERNARGEGISVFRVDPRTGSLELIQLVQDLVNPSFLALSRNGEFLYSVHGDETSVSSFKVDKTTGHLHFLNNESTGGRNPVHLALDPGGRFLVVTNHIGSSLAVLPVSDDGLLGSVTQLVPIDGPVGPHRIEQSQAKPHCSAFDPSGCFVVVPDKGLDRIFSFRFHRGVLTPASAPMVVAREGCGPRHVTFHPNQRFAYVVNELDSTVTTYRFAPETGKLAPLQILSTLPATFTGNSRAAGIAVAAHGRTLYASNRGHDSIAVFAIDPVDGMLAFGGAVEAGGRTPRFFSLSADETVMYVLNEDSDTIVRLSVDPVSGHLSTTGESVRVASPVCMIFSSGT